MPQEGREDPVARRPGFRQAGWFGCAGLLYMLFFLGPWLMQIGRQYCPIPGQETLSGVLLIMTVTLASGAALRWLEKGG
jgi:hypothetical protein